MKIILFALTSPLVGKISQSFHLDPFLAFTSLFWGLHLAYFSDQLSPLLSFKVVLDPMSNSLYVSDIAHHHIAVSGLLFWGSSLSRSISAAKGLRLFDLIRASNFFTYTDSILKIYSCYIRHKYFSSKHPIFNFCIYLFILYLYISLYHLIP